MLYVMLYEKGFDQENTEENLPQHVDDQEQKTCGIQSTHHVYSKKPEENGDRIQQKIHHAIQPNSNGQCHQDLWKTPLECPHVL